MYDSWNKLLTPKIEEPNLEYFGMSLPNYKLSHLLIHLPY